MNLIQAGTQLRRQRPTRGKAHNRTRQTPRRLVPLHDAEIVSNESTGSYQWVIIRCARLTDVTLHERAEFHRRVVTLRQDRYDVIELSRK